MPHKVVFGQRALTALQELEAYLVERSPIGARNVITEIHRTADLLGHFPMIGTAIPDTSTRYHVTRKYKYRLVYRLREDRVEILQVYHPRQDERPSP